MATTFDNILQKAAREGKIAGQSQNARDWFRSQAESTSATPTAVMREKRQDMISGPRVGNMYLFNYDPKMKKELPYYDTFPLIFMVGPADKGFYGLNMHYLPLQLRAVLMDQLYTLSTDKRYDERTRLKLSYDVLKSASRFRNFKPTFKHYLSSQVKSRFVKIDANEWDIALFLPLQRFKKATASKGWSDSRRIIAG